MAPCPVLPHASHNIPFEFHDGTEWNLHCFPKETSPFSRKPKSGTAHLVRDHGRWLLVMVNNCSTPPLSSVRVEEPRSDHWLDPSRTPLCGFVTPNSENVGS